MINKVLICCCCSEVSCCVAQCIDMWAAYEACGLAYINCGSCCWTVCAPICHTCSIGDFGAGISNCVKGVKHCLFSCLLCCVAPCDGCANCIFYNMDNCKSGVTGFKDMLKNTKFLA